MSPIWHFYWSICIYVMWHEVSWQITFIFRCCDLTIKKCLLGSKCNHMFPSMRKTQREFIQRIYKMANENRDWSNVPTAQEILLIFSRWSRQGIISFWSSPGRVSLLTYHLDCGKIANLIILVSAIRESNFIFPAIDLVLLKKKNPRTLIYFTPIFWIFSPSVFSLIELKQPHK